MSSAQCPECAGPGVPVVWGKPSTTTLRAAELGLVRAGGCIVRGAPASTWYCRTCGTSFSGGDTAEAIEAARAAVIGEGHETR